MPVAERRTEAGAEANARQRAQETLAGLVEFRELPRDLLQSIVRASRLRRLRARERIFDQGETARAFFVVQRGSVRVFRSLPDGREQTVHRLGPGRSFGEPAVLGSGVYPASAVAESTPTELVAVEAGPYLALLRSDPRLSAAVVGALSARMVELVERVEDLSVVGAAARLARYLLKLPARERGGALEIALAIRKQEIATEIAVTPETLSRVLARWRADGLVRARGRDLLVLDPAAIVAIADRSERAEPPVRRGRADAGARTR